MSLRGIRLVTFDATNTLLRFRIPPWVYYTHIARGYGFKGTEQQVHKKFHESYKQVWKYYPNFGCDTIGWNAWWKHVIYRTFKEHYELSGTIDKLSEHLIEDFSTSKCWTQADAASELIKNLREQNISVGIISNFDPRLYNVLDAVGFERNNFDFVLPSYETKILKPNPKIFNLALKSCAKLDPKDTLRNKEIAAHEALHIGDDYENDYCAAKQAGWKALLILNNKQSLYSAATQDTFQSLANLNDFLINKYKKVHPIPVVEPTTVDPQLIDANIADQSQTEQNQKTKIPQKDQTYETNEVPDSMKWQSTTKLAQNCIDNHTNVVAATQMVANNCNTMKNPSSSKMKEKDEEESTKDITGPELHKYSKESPESLNQGMPPCYSAQYYAPQKSAYCFNQMFPYQSFNSYYRYNNQGHYNYPNPSNQVQNMRGFINKNLLKK